MNESDPKKTSPEDDEEGSVIGTLSTLAFVLSLPLLVLLALGVLYILFRMIAG